MTSNSPIFIKKYAYLLGQYIQNCLLYKEGIKKPEVEELSRQFPQLELGELINKQQDLFGVIFNWKTSKIFVRYKGKEYDITDKVLKIVRKYIDSEWINNIGFDTRGFNVNEAFQEATSKIINKIINEEIE